MRITQINAERLSRVDPRIHARQHKVFLRRRECEVSFGEARRVFLRGGLDVLLDCRHGGM